MPLVSGASPVVLIYTLAHLFAAALTIGLAAYVARNHWAKSIGRAFTGMVGAASIWIVGSLARLFVTHLDAFIWLTVFKYIGIGAAPVCYLLFALIYDGQSQWVTRRSVSVLFVVPGMTLIVAGTTRTHGLFYSEFSTTTVDSVSVISIANVGPWYWVFLFYGWALVAIASALLVHAGFKRSRLYRLQVALLIPAVAISWAANIAYAVFSWPHPALDPTPLGFAATSALLALGVFSTGLVDVAPAARSVVLDAIEDGVIVLDDSDRVVDVNDAARSLIEGGVAIGDSVADLFSQNIAGAETTGTTTIELTVDSHRRFYRCRQLPVGPEGTHGSVVVLTDMTAEKESQQQLDLARERLRQIVDLVPDPLFVKTLDDEVVLSNEANAELHGMTPAEIEGKRERAIEADVENIENFDRYRQREREVIETGDPTTFEEELMCPDGETTVFKTTRIPFETVQRDEDAVLVYARDVTDLKEYERELEATKERLEQANEELETLNRILRHDIRNDVAVQSRLGRKLQTHVDEDGKEHLEQLLDRSEHIADITTGLRTLMQTMLDDRRELTAIRLDTVLAAEIENISAASEDATVRVSGPIPQVSVRADQMLSSVFQNILDNAIQHNDTATPEVAVSAQEREDDVVVRIADNGPGVPADVADELFDKAHKGLESSGTGIGLYLVSKLLDRYGGDIRLGSKTPRADEERTARAKRTAVDTQPQATELTGAVFVVTLPKV